MGGEMVRKEGKVRGEENQPCIHSNHTCEPAAVAMETRGACSESVLSQGRHNFLQKKSFDKNKEKIMKATLSRTQGHC